MASLSRRALRELAAAPSSSRRTLGATQALPRLPRAASAVAVSPMPIVRHFSGSTSNDMAKGKGKEKEKSKDKNVRINYNTGISVPLMDLDPDVDAVNYRRMTARDTINRKEPPTRAKMLVREFIHDSLYNPYYGYFAKNVDIFTPEKEEGYNFKAMSDQAMFQEVVGQRYETEYGGAPNTLGRQVWHTPTELFKPWYARSLISAIVAQYKLNHFPHQDLLIYEVGAGNGSFMQDALLYIRDEYPEIFARTKYKIIEISAPLAKRQRQRATAAGFKNVEVINEDFFKWRGGTEEPCFVVALEVFDNLSHDMIRYEMETLRPHQAIVSIDAEGDFRLEYEPVTDPLLARSLEYRRLLPDTAPNTQPPLSSAFLHSSLLRKLYTSMPLSRNLSAPEFVPTKAISFLERLRDQLPAHRLLMADFSALPDAVEGRNGPVVQTRYDNQMVPCSTFLVKQGYFDIFFPTDFELLRDMYTLIMTSPAKGPLEAAPAIDAPTSSSSAAPAQQPKGALARRALDADFFSPASASRSRGFRRRSIGVYQQAEFVKKFGGEEMVGPTRMRDGLSPMLTMYDNAKILF